MNAISLFPQALYKTNIGDIFKDEVQYLKTLPMQCDENPYFISPDMSKNVRILDLPQMARMKNTFTKYCDTFMKELLAIRGDAQLTQSWLNKNRPGEGTPRHLHSNSFVSGVFYMDIPGESQLIFHSNKKMFGGFVLEYARDFELSQKTIFGHEESYITVRTNDLVLFESSLVHSVPPNSQSLDRWCLAFNCITKGEIGSTEGLNSIKVL